MLWMYEKTVLLFAKAVSLHTTELRWRLRFATQQIRAEKTLLKDRPGFALFFLSAIST